MKRVLVICSGAIAALACMASIGVSTSFGAQVVLCHQEEEVCKPSNIYPEGSGVVLEATASPDQLKINGTLGETVKCASSKIEGTVGSGSIEGRTISIVSWGHLNCTNPLLGSCTSEAESLPYSAQVGIGGKMYISSPRLHFHCGGISPKFVCTYAEESGLWLWPGADHKSFTASEEEISQSGSSCEGESPHLSVTYRSSTPIYPALAVPQVTTEAAGQVRATQAALHGKVNPGGDKITRDWFECGTTTSYGTEVPATPEKAGAGFADVAVEGTYKGLEPSTTYHCRLVANGESPSGEGWTDYGNDVTFTTAAALTGAQLDGLAVTDPFDGSASSLADFGSNFAALGWAGGSNPKGGDGTGGWHSSAASGTVNGAYYAPNIADAGWGLAGAMKMRSAPTGEGYFSLWIDMPTPASSKAGYQLKVQRVSGGIYNVTLSKWVEGKQTELASKASYSMATGSSVALADQASKVSVWVDSGSGFTQLLSATDSSFASGRIGFDANSLLTLLDSFRSGAL